MNLISGDNLKIISRKSHVESLQAQISQQLQRHMTCNLSLFSFKFLFHLLHIKSLKQTNPPKGINLKVLWVCFVFLFTFFYSNHPNVNQKQ